MQINGIAHVYITVANFEACRSFYRRLLPFMGLTYVVRDTDNELYCIGGRTGVGITRCAAEYGGQPNDQKRAGLHHVCFRARSREDVDAVHALVRELGARIVRSPGEGRWAPGYYSVLFEDPDGVRLEINHIPGKGLLTELSR
ncbi:MAG: VOC family protein [Candidatus Binataceae bacterium]